MGRKLKLTTRGEEAHSLPSCCCRSLPSLEVMGTMTGSFVVEEATMIKLDRKVMREAFWSVRRRNEICVREILLLLHDAIVFKQLEEE